MNPPVNFYELLETGDFSVLFYDAEAAGSASRETDRDTKLAVKICQQTEC